MSTLILKNEMDTRYIIKGLYSELINVLNKAESNGDTVDLCDCKLSPSAASAIGERYGRIMFINSTDVSLNNILVMNHKIATTEYDEYEPIEIVAKEVSINLLIETVNTLTKGGSYRISFDTFDSTVLAYIALIIMSRPDLDLDVYPIISRVYEYIAPEWLKNAEEHDEYYLFISGKPILVKVENDIVTLPDGMTISIDRFIKDLSALPTDFGNKVLMNFDSTSDFKVSPEWKDVVIKCLNQFKDRVEEEKRRGKTIVDMLPVRGE